MWFKSLHHAGPSCWLMSFLRMPCECGIQPSRAPGPTWAVGQRKVLSLYLLCTCCSILKADRVYGHTLDSGWGYWLMSTQPESPLPCADIMSFPHLVLAWLLLTRVQTSVESYLVECIPLLSIAPGSWGLSASWVFHLLYVLSTLLWVISDVLKSNSFHWENKKLFDQQHSFYS